MAKAMKRMLKKAEVRKSMDMDGNVTVGGKAEQKVDPKKTRERLAKLMEQSKKGQGIPLSEKYREELERAKMRDALSSPENAGFVNKRRIELRGLPQEAIDERIYGEMTGRIKPEPAKMRRAGVQRQKSPRDRLGELIDSARMQSGKEGGAVPAIVLDEVNRRNDPELAIAFYRKYGQWSNRLNPKLKEEIRKWMKQR